MNLYSIIVTISIISLLYLVSKPLEKLKDDKWEIFFWTIFLSILGAKIFHLIENYNFYLLNSDLISISKGFSIMGAVTFGYLTLLSFERIKKFDLNEVKIKLFLFLPIVQAAGRIGNVSNNELLPFSYYEIVLNLLNFGILNFIYKKNPNLIVYFYFINYGLIRIFIESLKGNFNFLFFSAFFFFVYGFLGIYKLIYKV